MGQANSGTVALQLQVASPNTETSASLVTEIDGHPHPAPMQELPVGGSGTWGNLHSLFLVPGIIGSPIDCLNMILNPSDTLV